MNGCNEADLRGGARRRAREGVGSKCIYHAHILINERRLEDKDGCSEQADLISVA